jgi:hypothetical protein
MRKILTFKTRNRDHEVEIYCVESKQKTILNKKNLEV